MCLHVHVPSLRYTAYYNIFIAADILFYLRFIFPGSIKVQLLSAQLQQELHIAYPRHAQYLMSSHT